MNEAFIRDSSEDDASLESQIRDDDYLEALGRRRRYDPHFKRRALTPRRPRIAGQLREATRF